MRRTFPSTTKADILIIRAPRDFRVPRHYQVQDARYVPDHD
jgi:hypothetical protein